MDLPRVNPIGIVESPRAYEASPRRMPLALRLVAAALLTAFATAGTATTVATFGAYCLTSYAALPTGHPGPADGMIGGGALNRAVPSSERRGDSMSPARAKQD